MKKIVFLSFLALVLIGCSKTEEPMPKSSGYLPHYAQLKPVKSPENTQLYVYSAPNVKRSMYKSVIVEPVNVYQTVMTKDVKKKDIQLALNELNMGIKDIVSKSATVTETPGPGVARLNVAITGATVQGAGFSPMNIIPVSAAIKLASMATDLDSKTPVMVIELKFTDSVTGKSLLESLAVLNGETFRKRSSTPEEFATLAKMWIQKDLQYSLDQR